MGKTPPLATDPERSALMARIRQSGTKPELMVARALREFGIGYRKNARDLPGSPDFVNRGRRWAIFVNGCYWHHHRCRRGTIPKRNREFWVGKFVANRRRDARAIRELRRKGFDVLLIWECEVLAGGPMLARLERLVPARIGR
jgi:DNA mismatch endonuclease, patch repair protein